MTFIPIFYFLEVTRHVNKMCGRNSLFRCMRSERSQLPDEKWFLRPHGNLSSWDKDLPTVIQSNFPKLYSPWAKGATGSDSLRTSETSPGPCGFLFTTPSCFWFFAVHFPLKCNKRNKRGYWSWSEKKWWCHSILCTGYMGTWTCPTMSTNRDLNLGKVVTVGEWWDLGFESFTLWCSFEPWSDCSALLVVSSLVFVFLTTSNLRSWFSSSWSSGLQAHCCTCKLASFTTLSCKKCLNQHKSSLSNILSPAVSFWFPESIGSHPLLCPKWSACLSLIKNNSDTPLHLWQSGSTTKSTILKISIIMPLFLSQKMTRAVATVEWIALMPIWGASECVCVSSFNCISGN